MATQLPRFPELAKEIQIKIWQMTLEEPRIIELGETKKDWVWKGRVVARVDFWGQIQITSSSSRTTLVPAALETCVLSREVALKHYSRLGSARTWFNPAIDTLYFGKDWQYMEGLDHWRELVRKNTEIRHIAFHLPTARDRPDFFCIAEVALQPHIADVTFIVDAALAPCTTTTNGGGRGVITTEPAPRFQRVEPAHIAADKALRPLGKYFRASQRSIMSEAWSTHDTFFRRWGFYPDEWTRPAAWKMPKLQLVIEDEAQARRMREEVRVREELAAVRRAEAAAADVLKKIDPSTIDWNWTPPRDQFCACPYCN